MTIAWCSALARRPQTRNRRGRPTLEKLEERDARTTVDFKPWTGVLTITGTHHSDFARVTVDTHGTHSTQDDQVKVTGGTVSPLAVRPLLYKPDQSLHVTRIVFVGKGSPDIFLNETLLPCNAWGGTGDDELQGGTGNDLLVGDSGNDKLEGGGGNDELRGGWGVDFLQGGAGDDYLDDLIWEGDVPLEGGNDYLNGGAGSDVLFGRSSDDQLDGGFDSATDVLWGGGGADRFRVDLTFTFVDRSYVPTDVVKDFNPREGDYLDLW